MGMVRFEDSCQQIEVRTGQHIFSVFCFFFWPAYISYSVIKWDVLLDDTVYITINQH